MRCFGNGINAPIHAPSNVFFHLAADVEQVRANVSEAFLRFEQRLHFSDIYIALYQFSINPLGKVF